MTRSLLVISIDDTPFCRNAAIVITQQYLALTLTPKYICSIYSILIIVSMFVAVNRQGKKFTVYSYNVPVSRWAR